MKLQFIDVLILLSYLATVILIGIWLRKKASANKNRYLKGGKSLPWYMLASRDPNAPEGDQSAAVAQCSIVRTKDLLNWERLADLKTPSPPQRNVVLHPEFRDGKCVLHPSQDSFIEAGKGGGIGFGLADNIENAVVAEEIVIDKKVYHTIYEAKNGLDPAPIKTDKSWLHLAHGVRNTAAGLRYTLYMFLTNLIILPK